ncbi:MAG: hypothetical protein ACPL7M_03905 [Bryobacteraceae bacterium]
MFPWVYGFEWHAGYLIFLGVFFTVALVVAGTVLVALWRSFRTVQKKQEGRVYWHTVFEELTPEERRCRHAITGELPERCCDQEFDCRGCRMHERLLYSGEAAGLGAESAEVEVCGVAMPLDRSYHRGHTWVREAEDGTLEVGLDDLGRRLLGENGRVDVPAPGTEVRVNEPAFVVRRDGVEARVLSPVDGTVLGAGENGALIRVRPAEGFRTVHLLRDGEAVAWMRHEVDRLQMALAACSGAASLADGGTVPKDLGRALPRREFDTVCGLAFLDV